MGLCGVSVKEDQGVVWCFSERRPGGCVVFLWKKVRGLCGVSLKEDQGVVWCFCERRSGGCVVFL